MYIEGRKNEDILVGKVSCRNFQDVLQADINGGMDQLAIRIF